MLQRTPLSGPAVAPNETLEFARDLIRNRSALIGIVLIGLVAGCALFAPWLAPHSPIEQFREHLLEPPIWSAGGSMEFPFGTDDVGRCVLSRIIFGAQLSLLIGLIVLTVSMALGVGAGIVSATLGRLVDSAVMRLMDILIALPAILIAIVIVAILGPGLTNAMIAIAITYVPHYARLTRASMLAELRKDYVTASRIAGARPNRLIFRTVLPNCMSPLFVQGSMSFSSAILDAAGLGFLGLGAQPPAPEWGTMLAASMKYLQIAPWIVTLPGLAILITVIAFNLLGDGLRDVLDPKLKQ